MGQEEEGGVRAGAWKIEECGGCRREAYQVEMMMRTDIHLRTNVFYDSEWMLEGIGWNGDGVMTAI